VVRIKSSSKWQGSISELRINNILKDQMAISSEKARTRTGILSPLYTAVTFLRAKKKGKLGANHWWKTLEVRKLKYSVLGV